MQFKKFYLERVGRKEVVIAECYSGPRSGILVSSFLKILVDSFLKIAKVWKLKVEFVFEEMT